MNVFLINTLLHILCTNIIYAGHITTDIYMRKALYIVLILYYIMNVFDISAFFDNTHTVHTHIKFVNPYEFNGTKS